MRIRNRPAGFLGEQKMHLSKRLQRIADYIRPGDRIIDVGTDHAYIPIWLLLKDREAKAIATDIRPGPLERARIDAARYGVSDRLDFIECDGLTQCDPGWADTIIIAGMGGETIAGILEGAPWSRQKRLILQPQTKQNELRDYLADNGFSILDASLAFDNGRLYLIWLVGAGEMPPFRGVDSALLLHRDPLLKPYLEDQIKRLRRIARGVGSASDSDEALAAQLRERLAQLEEIYHEVITWQQ